MAKGDACYAGGPGFKSTDMPNLKFCFLAFLSEIN